MRPVRLHSPVAVEQAAQNPATAARDAGVPRHRAASMTGALALITGGVAWAAFALAAAARPAGCVGDACFSGATMRDTGDLGPLLIAGALLITGTLFGAGRSAHGRCLRIGGAMALSGSIAVTLAAAGATGFLPEETTWWAVVFPGVLAAMSGIALGAVGVLRARLLPAPAGAALVICALLLFVTNDQDARVLFLLPAAFAAVAVGGVAAWAARRSRTGAR